MTVVQGQKVSEEQLQKFHGRVLQDLSAAAGFACAYLGDRLGLYKIMATSGPVNSQELAKLSNASERYLREWLINQAAGGYVNYDSATKRYSLSPEAAEVLS